MTVISRSDVSDSLLVKNALSGNQAAFRKLVEQYSGLVYHFVYRMTQDADLADEMTQEVFVRVYKNLKTFDQRKPLKPWILRIAANTTTSALRKRSKVVSLDALTEEGDWLEPVETETRMPESMSELAINSEMVFRALHQLDPNYRQVLILRYCEEFSYEEIAQTLDVPINTVRTWIRRGLDRLRSDVKEVLSE